MSNADIVREALLAQNREDDDAFQAALHPDVEWDAGRNTFGLPEALQGADAVVRAAQEARVRVRRLTAVLHEVREAGDDVLVVGALSGGDVTMPRAWIWTLRDGQAVRVRAFSSRSAATQVWQREHPQE